MSEKEAKRPGRPRKHADQRTKTRAWRADQTTKRVDLYLNSSAYWRLKKLAEIWNCSIAGAVERLAIEAGEQGGKYEDLLFPDQE